MIAIRGYSSEIVQRLSGMLPAWETTIAVARDSQVPLDADRYLFCDGLLYGRGAVEMTDEEASETFIANCFRTMQECERVIAVNDQARICIVGSESGFAGSFDKAYAAAKAGLHHYVETRKLRTEDQQLVCIVPGIVGDAGMTTRRTDKDNLARRAIAHPKRRFLLASEVARLINFALYVDDGYLSGTVIRQNGGEHTCRT